jgi:hypothetical protein
MAQRIGTVPARLIGAIEVAAGVGIALFLFLTNTEPPHKEFKGHWGGTGDIVFMCVWLAFMAVVLGLTVRDLRK